MRTHLVSCIVVLLIVRASSAQDKPDFSGNWILVSPIDAGLNAAQTMTVHESFKRESVQGTPIDPPLITLAVDRRVNGSVRSELYTIGTIGGTVGGVVGNTGTGLRGQSRETRFSTGWDGDRLVIQITTDSGHVADAEGEPEHKEVWSLDAQGALLLIITDRASGMGLTTTTLLYRRRP
jgi:hypothetical protein